MSGAQNELQANRPPAPSSAHVTLSGRSINVPFSSLRLDPFPLVPAGWTGAGGASRLPRVPNGGFASETRALMCGGGRPERKRLKVRHFHEFKAIFNPQSPWGSKAKLTVALIGHICTESSHNPAAL